MSNSIISEGKTTKEAIENGLKILNVSKNEVDIKVLENEEKRSFFSILDPRVVKVELTVKEKKPEIVEKKEYKVTTEEVNEAKNKVEIFLKEFVNKFDTNIKYEIKVEDNEVRVTMNGENSGVLIGYRGETLNSLQTILSSIGNKNNENKVRVILDIENYREKRKKVLEELAEKVSKTVLRTGKSITLEPMPAYERKIIHSKLQSNSRIDTHSIGENQNRRIVISKI